MDGKALTLWRIHWQQVLWLYISKKIILYAGGSLGTNEYEHLKLLEEDIEKSNNKDAKIIANLFTKLIKYFS